MSVRLSFCPSITLMNDAYTVQDIEIFLTSYAAAPLEPVHFLSPDQQPGIQTPNNLGGT